MKKQSIWKLLTALTAATMVCTPVVVSAGIEEAGLVVDGSELTLHDFVQDEKLVLARGSFLASGSITLTDRGNREVGIGGDTSCYVDCDTVICNLYLEQKDDEGYWNTYDYWNYSTTDNHVLLVSTTRKVEGDHWYRARGSHIAILNNAIESTATLTDGIWID